MRSDEVSADVKVFIKAKNKDEHVPGLGLGVVELCERVERFGSLNKAACDMGMAYSKAWRIIKNAEEGLGIELFVRKGARGSCLTKESRALIALYRRVEKETSLRANEVLHDVLGRLVQEGVIVESSAPKLEKKATPELIAQVRALGL